MTGVSDREEISKVPERKASKRCLTMAAETA